MKRRSLFVNSLFLTLLLVGCVSTNSKQEIYDPAKAHSQQLNGDVYDQTEHKRLIIIATGDMSGVYFSLGQAMAEIFEKYNGTVTATQVTSASIENKKLVSQMTAEIGFAAVDTLALKEKQADEGENSVSQLRALTGLYSNYLHIVTTKNSGIHSLNDLIGKRVSLGIEGSGTKLIAERTLGAVGYKRDEIQKSYLSFSQSADALRDGTIDAAFISSGLPNPEIERLASDIPIKLIPISGKIITQLHHQFGFYTGQSISRETYPGMKGNIQTIATKNVLFTYQDLSKEEAYEIVDTFYKHLTELQKVHPAAQDIHLNEAIKEIPLDFHPGATKYFIEHDIVH